MKVKGVFKHKAKEKDYYFYVIVLEDGTEVLLSEDRVKMADFYYSLKNEVKQ